MNKNWMKVVIIIALILVTVTCGVSAQPPTPFITPTPTPTVTPVDITELSADEVIDSVASRTAVPKEDPDVIDEIVVTLSDQIPFINNEDIRQIIEGILNVFASLLIVFIGFIVGRWLFFNALEWVTKRIQSDLITQSIQVVRREIWWLVLLFIVEYSLLRLEIWPDSLKVLFTDIFFFIRLGVGVRLALRVIHFGTVWIMTYQVPRASRRRIQPVVDILKRITQFIVGILAVGLTLSHLGLNIAVFSSGVVLIGVLGAIGIRESVADLTSGLLLLLDPPFHVGDTIHIREADLRGEVVGVAIRMTHIRTFDNIIVSVPNSLISSNQIINFTDPDPTLRVYVDVGVGYETDIPYMREVVLGTVQKVEGVLLSQPIEVLFFSIDDFALKIRVRFWINHPIDEFYVKDRVNEAIMKALPEAGIDIPYPIYTLRSDEPQSDA